MPLRTASTPATKVVATAPMPGIITPSLPLAGLMFEFSDRFSDFTSTPAAAFLVDFFPVAIMGLHPYQNCEVCTNPSCSRIRQDFCKCARPNVQNPAPTGTARIDWKWARSCARGRCFEVMPAVVFRPGLLAANSKYWSERSTATPCPALRKADSVCKNALPPSSGAAVSAP